MPRKAAKTARGKAPAGGRGAVMPRVASIKDEYMKKLEDELKAIDSHINELKKKKSKIDKKLGASYKETMDALNEQKAAAKERLRQAKASWRDITRGVESAWRELKRSVEKARKKFK